MLIMPTIKLKLTIEVKRKYFLKNEVNLGMANICPLKNIKNIYSSIIIVGW